uniref:ubiquitinyl hydrolase 1 n=1 Tax=Rhizophagus irregularis (strain DAOM 181602 / DAOM 197198 / MUCL 43194) TaxID=747089 RepID=U9U1U2_RHIID
MLELLEGYGLRNANIGVIFGNSPPVFYLQLKRLFANSGEAHEGHYFVSINLEKDRKWPKLKYHRPEPGFDLVLGKKWTYEQVAGAVATRLNDPLKLRFTIEHLASGTPKNVIKRTINQTLSEMISIAYGTPIVYVLFYEMLETSIVLEAKKFFKVYWLANTVKKRKIIDIRLQKNTIISKHIEEISNKVTLSSPNSRIMLFEVYHNKIQKEYTESEPIMMILKIREIICRG